MLRRRLPFSLATRLTLLLTMIVMAVMMLVGLELYRTLEHQLSLRDDAALLNRIAQIRTLLLDEDAVRLIHQKPRLFGNMLGNRESLLVIRFPGQAPLIEINPGQSSIPNIPPVGMESPLALSQVHHGEREHIPFISAAALAHTRDGDGRLEIITGRLMTERSETLARYRSQIILVITLATLLVGALAALVIRKGLSPLRQLARETSTIGINNLSRRIVLKDTPPELHDLIGAFNQMLDRLEHSFHALSQVSADMAHDLRTPISNLLGQTEVAMAQKRSSEYYLTLLGSNFEELQRLSRMIDNMLFLARAEDARHAIECAPLALAEEFARLEDYFEGPAAERGVELTRVMRDDLATPAAPEVWANQELLRRALANLLANAIRYADEGSSIILSAHRHPKGTLLSVENHGPALSPEQQQRVFERFYRADSARSNTAGSGLGLSIVRSIMSLHQGQAEVSSSAGVTRFSLIFPPPPHG